MDLDASFLTLAELAEGEIDGGAESKAATADEIEDLRRFIADELVGITNDWPDRLDAPLRVTKRRLRAMALCPAQILSEANEVTLNASLAAGVICDIAAGLLSVNPRFPAEGGWLASLRGAIEAERPDIVDFVDSLGGDDYEEFVATIDDRCSALPYLMGDVSGHRPYSHERATVRFVDANVWLTAEIDLSVGTPRVLAEVKTGSYNNWVPEELRHYGLVIALRDRRSPKVGAAMTLTDQKVTAVSLGLAELELAAKRVVSTVEDLVAVDKAATGNLPAPTRPGSHCRWCEQVRVCDGPSDLVLAELEADGPLGDAVEVLEGRGGKAVARITCEAELDPSIEAPDSPEMMDGVEAPDSPEMMEGVEVSDSRAIVEGVEIASTSGSFGVGCGNQGGAE